MLDLISIGDTVIDTFVPLLDAEVEERGDLKMIAMRYGDKIPVGPSVSMVAGNAANSAVGGSRLGMDTAIYTNVGDDVDGEKIVKKFKEEEIKVTYVVRNSGMVSNHHVVLDFKSERTILIYHQPWKFHLPDLDKSKWVYLTSLSPSFVDSNLMDQLTNYLERSGAKLVYNPGTFQIKTGVKKYPRLLSLTELFVVNVEEAKVILGIDPKKKVDIKTLLVKMADLGPRKVVLTDGGDGSYGFDGEGFWKLGIFKAELVEMTGSGDAFATGTMAGLFYALNLRHRVTTPGTDTPEVKLYKAVNGVTTLVANTHNVTLEHSIPYKVKIEVVGEHIQAWIGNNLIFDLDDPGTTLKTGGIGITYWTGTVSVVNIRVDNVKVTGLSTIPKTPVIFIPGIGGSELRLKTLTNWSEDNGHGGIYSHAYTANENIWLNESEAAKLGEDDYFDILRIQTNGVDSAANIIAGDILPQGYPNIDSYFTGLGYTKNVDYFTFPYDWRKDVTTNISGLSSIINTAIQTSGKSKVNVLAHSLGGLVARSYMNEGTNSARINKLIELGTPHLGSVKAVQSLIYGEKIVKPFLYFIEIGLPSSELLDIFQNFPSVHSLIPPKKYYAFQSPELAWAFYPFSDESDIDLNGETGILDYSHLKTLLSNIGINMTVYQMGEALHDSLDEKYSTPTGIPVYLCVGNGFPTLGQIRETYHITWPTNMFPKTDQIYINGDDTVPNASAALKNTILDLSGGATIYYANQRHSDLANPNGACMSQASNWLKDIPQTTPDSTPSLLEGTQISIDSSAVIELTDSQERTSKINDNREVKLNIPGTLLDKIGQTMIAFVNRSSGPVTANLQPTDNTHANITVRNYQNDTVHKTTIYQNIDLNLLTTLSINTPNSDPKLINNSINITPTSSATSSAALDITPPTTTASISGTLLASGSYEESVTITFSAKDTRGAGILQTRYSIETTSTPSTYLRPITLSEPGTFTIYYGSTDNLGNDERTKTLTLTITAKPTTSTSSTSTGGTSSSGGVATSTNNSDSSSSIGSRNTPTNPLVAKIQELASPIIPNISTDNNQFKAVLGTNIITIHLDWLDCLKKYYRNQLKLFGVI